MKKEQILNLMNTVGPDLIEEADIQAPAKRRLPKAVRTGLIAACLCLALLGTAFATANPEAVANFLNRFTPVQVESIPAEDGGDKYHVSYTATRFPIDSFSPALLAAGEGRDSDYVQRRFDTWEEAHAFIGEDIPCFFPESNGRQFVVDMTYSEDKLVRIEVFRDYASTPWTQLSILTEYFFSNSAGFVMIHESAAGDKAQVEILEPYSMANGCQAEIAAFIDSADSEALYSVGCMATFVLDGVEYWVDSFGLAKEEALAELYDTLDLFP